jgi:hypothetical protein
MSDPKDETNVSSYWAKDPPSPTYIYWFARLTQIWGLASDFTETDAKAEKFILPGLFG